MIKLLQLFGYSQYQAACIAPFLYFFVLLGVAACACVIYAILTDRSR